MKSSTKCTNNHDIALACLFQWWRLMTKSPQAIIQKWSPCNTIVLITFFFAQKTEFFSYQAGFKHITSIKSGKSYLPRGMRIHTPLKLPSGCMDRPSGLSEHGPAYPKKAQQAHLSLGTKNIYCTLSRSSPPLNTALCPLHCPQRWKRRPSGRPRASAHCRPPPESKCLMPVRILCQPFANPPQASSPNSSP
jgi:hypothetical protein